MNQSQLKKISIKCAHKIIAKKIFLEPYKHLVVDNFLPIDLAEKCLSSFPNINDSIWEHEHDNDIEVKSRTTWTSEFDIPDNIIDAVKILNGAHLLRAFSEVFNIQKLLPDAYYNGGGLNIMQKGGLLGVHVDGNYHDASGLNRRLNVLLYLNSKWNKDWGGELGLYDRDGKSLIKKIAPIFNRLVVFDTNDYSFHGIPTPLNCPSDESRKSIILYYYTKESRPANQSITEKPHSALWVKRSLKDKKGNSLRKKYE